MPENRDFVGQRHDITGSPGAFAAIGRTDGSSLHAVSLVGDRGRGGTALKEPLTPTPLEQVITEPSIGLQFNPGHTEALLGNSRLAQRILNGASDNGEKPTTVEVPLSTIRTIMTTAPEADRDELRFLMGQEVNQVGLDGLIATYGYVARQGGTDESSVQLREKMRGAVIDTIRQHAALSLLPKDMRPVGYDVPDLNAAAMQVLEYDKAANRT